MDTKFAPGPAKTFRVRGDQIDEQDCTDEMPAGKNGKLEPATFRRPPNEETLEVALLRLVNPEMDLCECAGKNEAMPAARHTIVNFSDVIRSTILRSISLKSELIE